MKSILTILIITCGLSLSAQIEKTFNISKRYLNVPIQSSLGRQRVDFFVGKEKLSYYDIKIADTSVDYWTFFDVSAYKGKKFTLVCSHETQGIELIFQADTIVGEAKLYKEEFRPQIHYTTRRGWTNDPNGMVYYDGEYHLFYQHNPFEINWGNMTWNHAVSKDLLHWEELSLALLPDTLGTMFSGSAVIDYNNTAGFNQGETPAMLAFYTADLTPQGEHQCIAYSVDKGRTFTKFGGNPVLPIIKRFGSKHARDPKTFWYEPGKHWVMIMHEGLAMTIYNSTDFKTWELTDTLTGGFWECPELFELSVDGQDNHKKWVVFGVNGTYQIGSFDGKQFIAETEMLRYNYRPWSMTAAQTFNDEPKGRRVAMGWGHARCKGMPYTESFTFPMEMSLRTTPNGVRLHVNPVGELQKLHGEQYYFENEVIGEKLNEKLKAIDTPHLHLKTTLKIDNSRFFGLNINGYKIKYDVAMNTLNGAFVPLQDQQLDLEVIVDKTILEVYINGGRYYWFDNYTDGDLENFTIGFIKGGDHLHPNPKTIVQHLEIHELDSIW